MRLYTCGSGVSLLAEGHGCRAWGDNYYTPGDYIVEVPAEAVNEHLDENREVYYEIIRPGMAKIISGK